MGLSECAPAGQGLGSPSNNEGSNNTMFKSTRKSKMVKVAAAAAAVGSIAAIGLVGNSPAQADPQFPSAFVGVGSDTTQDVLNALAGYAPHPTGPATSGGTRRRSPATASRCCRSTRSTPTRPVTPASRRSSEALPSTDRTVRATAVEALSRPKTAARGEPLHAVASPTCRPDRLRSVVERPGSSGDTGTALTYSVLGRDAVRSRSTAPVLRATPSTRSPARRRR